MRDSTVHFVGRVPTPAAGPPTGLVAETEIFTLPEQADEGVGCGSGDPPHKNLMRKGSALLTVLWLTAALSAIGLAVANNVRSETERAATNVDDVKAYFIARGAIERTAMRMFWGPDFFTPLTVAL